jgi:hypothetical protein
VGNHEGRSRAADAKGIGLISKVNAEPCGRLGLAQLGLAAAQACRAAAAQACRAAARARARGGLPFYGARARGYLPRAAAAMAAWPMGLAGRTVGPERVGSGHRLGPIR